MIRFAIAAVLIAAPAAAANPLERTYVIERVGDRIAPDAVIGPKGVGLVCMPNGHLRWSQITLGGQSDRRDTVQDILEDAGLPVTTLSEGTPMRRQIRLRGTVTDVSAKLCARNVMTGGSDMSGAAKLTVEWRGEEMGGEGKPFRHLSAIERLVPAKSPIGLGVLGRLLLEDAARDLATWLKAGMPPDSSPS